MVLGGNFLFIAETTVLCFLSISISDLKSVFKIFSFCKSVSIWRTSYSLVETSTRGRKYRGPQNWGPTQD